MAALLDLLFPSNCVVCERSPLLVCPGCLPTPVPRTQRLSGLELFFALDLEGSAERLISGYKDQTKLALARYLAAYLDEALAQLGQTPQQLAFPPSSRANFSRRGYNPVAVVCSKSRLVGGLPQVKVKLKRQTIDQRSLGAKQREENLQGAFEIELGKGQVMIIDDVVTTGATAQSLAKELERAGYEVTGICAIARRNQMLLTSQIKKA